MKFNNNRILNYYQQLINKKKIEISMKEKELNDIIFNGFHTIYYTGQYPSSSHFKHFHKVHKELGDLYNELFKLQDRYLDIKGQEGLLYGK